MPNRSRRWETATGDCATETLEGMAGGEAAMSGRVAMRIAGLLLAAGRGRRMGTVKQLLPWGERGSSTVVAAAFDGIAPWCDAGITVVLGAEAPRVAAALRPRVFDVVAADSDAEMFESIRAGFRALLARSPAVFDHVLLHPADHPIVEGRAIERLIAHAKARARPCVGLMPICNGKGGHPALIPRDLLPCVIAWRGLGGLRAFWEANPQWTGRVECLDAPGVIRDLDTPNDYRLAR